MKIADMRTEDLIKNLCIGYHKTTKKAADTEKKIITELANRGIVDKAYMEKELTDIR